jgi:hypothetical protein
MFRYCAIDTSGDRFLFAIRNDESDCPAAVCISRHRTIPASGPHARAPCAHAHDRTANFHQPLEIFEIDLVEVRGPESGLGNEDNRYETTQERKLYAR